MGIPEQLGKRIEAAPSREGAPRPQFHGMLMTPEQMTLPGNEPAVATFNAALVAIPNGEGADLVAAYRVMTASHEQGKPDATKYIGMQSVNLTPDGMHTSEPLLISASSLLALEDRDKNPEDIRLRWDEQNQRVIGGLTEAVAVAKDDGNFDAIPYIASIEGVPEWEGNTIRGIHFGKAELLKDASGQPFAGKNVHAEIGPDGDVLYHYRPEYGEDGTTMNQTHVRTLRKTNEGYAEQVGEDRVYQADMQKVLPEGYSLYKFGLNGKTVDMPDGTSFRVDHVCMKDPDGKFEYQFITVGADGTIKPLLRFDDVVSLTGAVGEDLTGEKRVIYCNGTDVVDVLQPDGTTQRRFVMAVTLFDKSIAILSYDLAELAAYAVSVPERELAPVGVAGRRDGPVMPSVVE